MRKSVAVTMKAARVMRWPPSWVGCGGSIFRDTTEFPRFRAHDGTRCLAAEFAVTKLLRAKCCLPLHNDLSYDAIELRGWYDRIEQRPAAWTDSRESTGRRTAYLRRRALSRNGSRPVHARRTRQHGSRAPQWQRCLLQRQRASQSYQRLHLPLRVLRLPRRPEERT